MIQWANPINTVSEKVAGNIAESSLAKSSIGKKIHLDSIDSQKLTNGVVTVAVVFGPDICKACMGKISVKQLAKNATAGAAGIAGMVIGNAVTAGNPLGGMVGGVVGGAVGKKVMDNFIEDDAVAMFRVMKEEFLNVVMSSYLSQEDLRRSQEELSGIKKYQKNYKICIRNLKKVSIEHMPIR